MPITRWTTCFLFLFASFALAGTKAKDISNNNFGKRAQEVAFSIQMEIGRFYFPPLSMFPVLENKNVRFPI